MERQRAQLVRLIDDLTDVNRIRRGKLALKQDHLDLRSALGDAVEISRPAIDAAGHRLDIDLPAVPVWIDGDAVRLTQVFSNLLNNAARYTPAGGRLRLDARTEGDGVRIAVTDTGIGIPPDMLETIFGLFVQSPHSGRQIHGGLGIGLTLARRLVELHGGTIAAHRAGLGRGAVFEARLPLGEAREPAAGAEPPAVATPAAQRSRRVLVVDDNPDSTE